MNQHASFARALPQDFPETSLGGYLPVARNMRKSLEDSRPSPPATVAAFVSALDRLEEALDQETSALQANQPANLDDLGNRKSRSLLELTRLSRTLPPVIDEKLRQRLQRLNSKLAQNRAVLALHLSAVREIAELLVTALGDADSDGTYAVSGHR